MGFFRSSSSKKTVDGDVWFVAGSAEERGKWLSALREVAAGLPALEKKVLEADEALQAKYALFLKRSAKKTCGAAPTGVG